MEQSSEAPPEDVHLPIAQLPATALQALYHAVTGKTENLSKGLTKSVIIRRDDLDRLFAMLNQQMQHYTITAGPTTTVKLTYANRQSQQFSSWERFHIQDASTLEITDGLVIKFEFLLRLPDTLAPQRCVINIDIDSKLPVASNASDDKNNMFGLPLWIICKLPTVEVSIDFVDYLIAKIFCQIIEDWFSNIPELRTRIWISRLLNASISWQFVFNQISLIALAGFTATYVMLRGGIISNLGQLAYLSSTGMILLALTAIATRYSGRKFVKSLQLSSLPSMIILTKGDQVKSDSIIEESGKTLGKVVLYSTTAVVSVVLNIAASYVYSWLTK